MRRGLHSSVFGNACNFLCLIWYISLDIHYTAEQSLHIPLLSEFCSYVLDKYNCYGDKLIIMSLTAQIYCHPFPSLYEKAFVSHLPMLLYNFVARR